jgi:hypothetical protein
MALLFLLAVAVIAATARPTSTQRSGSSAGAQILLPRGMPSIIEPGTEDPLMVDYAPAGSCADGTLAFCLPGEVGYPAGDPYLPSGAPLAPPSVAGPTLLTP